MRLTKLQSLFLNVGVIVIFLAVSWFTGSTTWASLIGGISGLFCVWLTAQENIWNYPIGFVNIAAWFYMFREAHLYADAWLQVFFGVLMAWGWYVWLTKRENKPVRPTTHVKLWEIVCAIVVIVAGTYFWGRFLVTLLRHMGWGSGSAIWKKTRCHFHFRGLWRPCCRVSRM